MYTAQSLPSVRGVYPIHTKPPILHSGTYAQQGGCNTLHHSTSGLDRTYSQRNVMDRNSATSSFTSGTCPRTCHRVMYYIKQSHNSEHSRCGADTTQPILSPRENWQSDISAYGLQHSLISYKPPPVSWPKTYPLYPKTSLNISEFENLNMNNNNPDLDQSNMSTKSLRWKDLQSGAEAGVLFPPSQPINGAATELVKSMSSHMCLELERRPPHINVICPFCLSFRWIDGIRPDNGDSHSLNGAKIKDGRTTCDYLLRVSLFDSAYKQFFGRTWSGQPQKASVSGQKIKLSYNQNVYFHTSVSDEHILLVVEVVALSHTDEGKEQRVSCGWGFYRLFSYEGDLPDVSSNQAGPTQKIDMYNGTPRALMYMEEPVQDNPLLSKITNCQAVFTLRTHRKLAKIQNLLPENVLVGLNDHIPGLAEGTRDPKTGVPDTFKKPKSLKSYSCHLDNISVALKPSIQKFEEELLRQLNEDRGKTEVGNAEDAPKIVVEKRYLQVGVHNGWGYIGEPEIVLLQFEGGLHVKKTSSFRKGHKRTGSNGSVSGVRELVHKNRVQLDGMLEDASLTVVFFLVYECGTTAPKPNSKASFSHSSFTVSIRWAAFCPFSHLTEDHHSVDLQGGPGSNPDSLLVFQSDIHAMGSTFELTHLSGGTLSFSMHSEPAGKENLSYRSGSLRFDSPLPDMGGAVREVQSYSAHALQSRPPPPPNSFGNPPAEMSFPQKPPGGYASTTPRSVYGSSPYHMPVTAQRSGYMPIEIQHMAYDNASPNASLRLSMQELQELPFTPVHAPIMAVAPGMHSGQKLSRAAYAKLYTAGFPQILDGRGEAPEVVDPADVIHFVAAKEEADRLQANELYFQFLAFARCGELEFTGGKQVSTVFFTFQFYRFPQITTERLLLGKPQGELASDPAAMPCLLQQLEKDGSRKKAPPGYQVKYHLDPSYLKPGEGRLFVNHLAQQTLHIDVWDGDSLHLIGSCAVELQHLCRQGREAIQVTYELDVVSTEYVEHETALHAGDMTRDGSVRPIDVNTVLKGRLHLRMASVGHPADPKLNRDAVPVPRKPKTVVNNETGVSSFLGGSLNAINSHTKALARTKICKAQHLVETNHELASVLFSKKDKTLKEVAIELSQDNKRKLSRMDTIRKIEDTGTNVIGTFRQEKEERSRDLKTIELYRNQNKNEGILNMLNQAITTEHTINPSLGTTEFFEFVLRNPYNVEHTVVLDVEDPEVIPITDTREWRHFKMLNELYTSVEEGMFNLDTKSGKPEIFLRPKEKVYVPFKYLTFKADHSVKPHVPLNSSKNTDKNLMYSKKVDDPLQTRLIRVNFRTQEGKPIAILAVRVEPQPHVVDQTFRFHHPEQSFLKKSIRMPPMHSLPGVPVGGAGMSQIYVRCSDPNVICDSKKVPVGEPHDIFIKVACGASPTVKRFFVTMYMDPYLSKPLQVWQFYVHAMQRVDVACVEGQTSRFTLILRGTHASRLVQCYSSHALEMQLHPTDPFMLAANTLQEIHVGVRPQQVGTKFLYINVVDIEYHQLIRSWLVCVNSRVPMVTKAFELRLPLGGGKGSNKKITYTNPYPMKRLFHVRTNREDLMQFKDTRLDLAGGQTATIGIRFAPCMNPGMTEILVFINDEDDKNEETFCVKAIYQ